MIIQKAGQNLHLPEHALFWEDQKTLIVSDIHLGKTGHFRKHGIPIPGKSSHEDLSVLLDLIVEFSAEKLLILGDLFHSDINSEWFLIREWRQECPETEIILVPGNHDQLERQTYSEAGINLTDEQFQNGPFLFSHDIPKDYSDGQWLISGHIHPVTQIRGIGRQSMNFPCFYLREKHLILPSFGFFTGGHKMDSKKADEIYAVIDREEIIKIEVEVEVEAINSV